MDNLGFMPITIIVKDGKPKGVTRTSVDERLRDSGWGSSFKSDEDSDKCAFLERKLKKEFNVDSSQVPAALINRVLTENSGSKR